MKKFGSSLLVFTAFMGILVLQMLVNGQKLTANKLTKNVEKYAVYENEFSKLQVVTTKATKIDFKSIEEPIVLVNFWASWCLPCLAEFPSLNKLVDKYPGKVRVVGINNDDEGSLKKIKKTENKYKLLFESVKDEEGNIASNFNIQQVPASITFYKGKVIHFSNKEFDFMSDAYTGLLDSKL